MLKHSHPSYQHNIPYLSSMNIGKLGSGVSLKSDICSVARKTRRLILKKVQESVKYLRKDDSDDIRVL